MSPEHPPGVQYHTNENMKELRLPFSEAVSVGNLLYLSGQIGIGSSMKLVSKFYLQTYEEHAAWRLALRVGGRAEEVGALAAVSGHVPRARPCPANDTGRSSVVPGPRDTGGARKATCSARPATKCGKALRPELVPGVKVVEVLPTADNPAVLDLEDDAATHIEAMAVPFPAVMVNACHLAVITLEYLLQRGLERTSRLRGTHSRASRPSAVLQRGRRNGASSARITRRARAPRDPRRALGRGSWRARRREVTQAAAPGRTLPS